MLRSTLWKAIWKILEVMSGMVLPRVKLPCETI